MFFLSLGHFLSRQLWYAIRFNCFCRRYTGSWIGLNKYKKLWWFWNFSETFQILYWTYPTDMVSSKFLFIFIYIYLSKFRLIFCVETSCKSINLQGVYVSICAMLTTNHRAVGVNMYLLWIPSYWSVSKEFRRHSFE